MSDVLEVYDISTEAVEVITEGPQGPTGPAGDGTLGYYGAFSDYTSQTITSITAAYAMTLNTTDESNGVSRGTPTSKIQFTNAATYNVQWSGQFQNTNNSDHDVRVWLKKNGTDISGSTGFASIPSRHGQVDGHTIIGWNYILTLAAGDYLQFYWSADSTAVSIQTYSVGSNPTTPSTASLIVTAQQVMNLQLGPTGPQGPAGTAGGISSLALAGTGLSITGSPVTTSGTITANVAYGTTAGTACQGNDARIANIGSGAINTATGVIQTQPETLEVYSLGRSGLADLKVYSVQLVDDQNTGYVGSLSMVNDLTADRGYYMPNATGTVALTQQATDYEVTDSSAGIIMKSPNNSRWRITIDNNGVLLRTALTLLFSLAFMCGAKAQVRDLVYGTNNVVIGPTNTNALSFTNSVAFSNPISFGTNAPTVRTNLGLGASWLTNSNSPTTTNATNLIAGTLDDARLSTNVAILSNLPSWATTTNAATARTNLGVTVASNLPAPYSGAAATNSLLVANGTGGSTFVSTLPSLTIGVGTNTDVTLQRETNNSLAQRNGTNPQTLFLFNTYSNSTNYERGKIAWTNNVLTIGTEKGTGGGTARGLELQTDGTTRLTVGSGFDTTVYSGVGTPFIIGSSGTTTANGAEIRLYGGNYGGQAMHFACGSGIYRFSSDRTGGNNNGFWLTTEGTNNVLALQNGTNPQTCNIYGSYTNSTNYRRLAVGMSNSGTAFIRPESAGPLATNNLIYISGLPTNSTGLPSGVLWNSNGSVVVSP